MAMSATAHDWRHERGCSYFSRERAVTARPRPVGRRCPVCAAAGLSWPASSHRPCLTLRARRPASRCWTWPRVSITPLRAWSGTMRTRHRGLSARGGRDRLGASGAGGGVTVGYGFAGDRRNRPVGAAPRGRLRLRARAARRSRAHPECHRHRPPGVGRTSWPSGSAGRTWSAWWSQKKSAARPRPAREAGARGAQPGRIVSPESAMQNLIPRRSTALRPPSGCCSWSCSTTPS